jgi:hypothetical protein
MLIIKVHLISDVTTVNIQAVDSNELDNSNDDSKAYSENTFTYKYSNSFEEEKKSLNSHDALVLNVNEYVAKVKGGFKEARKIAKRLNLKLVKKVRMILISIQKLTISNIIFKILFLII